MEISLLLINLWNILASQTSSFGATSTLLGFSVANGISNKEALLEADICGLTEGLYIKVENSALLVGKNLSVELLLKRSLILADTGKMEGHKNQVLN